MLFAAFLTFLFFRVFLFVYRKTRKTGFSAGFAVIMAVMAAAIKLAVWEAIDLASQAVSTLF